MPQREPWHAVATDLVDVAAGRAAADLVIRGGRWVNVLTREVVPGMDIAVRRGRIACIVEDAGYCVGDGTRVVEAEGRYLAPGLTDGHLHVESSMCTITEYVRAVLPHGTTAIFADPHEIANVFGLDGVRMMVAEAEAAPIHVFVQMPSCVPSAPGLETPGARITPQDVEEALSWPGIVGLGEMMNFPGVVEGDAQMHAEMAATMRAGKTVGGHYPSPELDRRFHAYVAGGPADDHENTREVDAVERARRGMRPMLRLGSAWYDVAAQITAITKRGLDPRQFILCTDDVHAGTLVAEGHMDRVLRHAIALGLDPLIALQMATINTAQHFGVDRDLGCLAPGRYADVVLAESLDDFAAGTVIARGEVAAEEGRLLLDLPPWTHEERFRRSVRVPRPLAAADFAVDAGNRAGPVTANVIGVIENHAATRHLTATLEVRDGQVQPDPAQDVLPLSLVERHHGTGRVVNGFVQGFGFDDACGVATTVAHDCHHLLVTGTCPGNMAQAVNALVGAGGGVVVVREGTVIALVELPIGGLMSDEPAGVVAEKSARVMEALGECGCALNNGYMQLSLLALAVIPELRISDLGLVDVSRFTHIPVIADSG